MHFQNAIFVTGKSREKSSKFSLCLLGNNFGRLEEKKLWKLVVQLTRREQKLNRKFRHFLMQQPNYRPKKNIHRNSNKITKK